jgi:hypothetical protein
MSIEPIWCGDNPDVDRSAPPRPAAPARKAAKKKTAATKKKSGKKR